MLDNMERFLNKRSKKDNFWGPSVRWRPAYNSHFRAGLIFRMLVPIATSIPFVLVFSSILETWVKFSMPSVSAVGPVFWSAALSSFFDMMIWLYPLALVLRLLMLLPHAWAWNRRADRINREPPKVGSEEATSGVWPPPPRVSKS